MKKGLNQSKPFIEATDLTIKYGDFVAVDGVSFSIGRGLTYLLGPNGSGKTSVIKALTGLLKPFRGEISVLGCDPLDISCINDKIHVAFEETNLPEHVLVKDYLESIAYLRSYSGEMNHIYRMLELDRHLHKRISELSKGLKRRVTLTTLFIGEPKIIIIDEPYNGLDLKASIMLNELITDYVREHSDTAILISTHIIPPIRPDKIILLANGKKIYDGKPPEENIKIKVRRDGSTETVSITELNEILRSMKTDIEIFDVQIGTIYDFIAEKIFGRK